MSEHPDTERRLEVVKSFFAAIPHSAVLGIEPVAVTAEHVTARIPYKAELVGNPDTGVVHGGVITTLVDQTCGAAVIAALDPPEVVVTLDLRLDHLQPAQPQQPIWAQAHCYRLTRHIAFVRCVVYQTTPAAPIATSMSTFMRVTHEDPNPGRAV
ncbi:MAG TPA: PaaI family thioesterase [Nitrococcus sp.]|nr:PaaI family thioesterase [Nitrococcus sp.]